MAGFTTKAGAVAGVPLALLINRYLLGNKSLKSALWAGALGAGTGAAAGYGLDKYMEGKALVDSQKHIAAYNDEVAARERMLREIDAALNDRSIDFTSPEGMARLDELLKPFGGLQANRDYVLRMLAGRDAMDRIRRFDATRHGIDMPLIDVSVEDLQRLNEFSAQFRSRDGSAEQGRETQFGGLRPEEFGRPANEVSIMFDTARYGLLNADGTPLNPRQMAAMMVYHNRLKDIYTSSAFNDDNKLNPNLRTPEMLDYIAVHSMPPQLRTALPVEYRLVSIARARASNGWSYSIDRQMLFDPQYRHFAPALTVAQDDLLNLGETALVAATAKAPMLNGLVATAWGPLFQPVRGVNASNLPRWTLDMDSTSGDSWAARNNRHSAVRLLSGDREAATASGLSWVPLYSWMLPEAQRRHRHRAASSLLTDVAYTAVDARQFMDAANIGRMGRTGRSLDPSVFGLPPRTTRHMSLLGMGMEGFGLGMDALSTSHNMNNLRYGMQLHDGDPETQITGDNLPDYNQYYAYEAMDRHLPGSSNEGRSAADQLTRSVISHLLAEEMRNYQQAWGN